MDKFVTVKKSTSTSFYTQAQGGKAPKEKQHATHKFTPYETRNQDGTYTKSKFMDPTQKRREASEKMLAPLIKDGKMPSRKALTKHLLNTLADESNPITHSDIYSRSDYVTSAATGHQRGEGHGPRKPYEDSRRAKLKAQLPEKADNSDTQTGLFFNIKIYIDGYLANTTDIEMKRVVTLAGGQVLYSPSGATHILTSQQLSGSKTHKLLTTKSKTKPHVVRPEWVTDSIEAGKRLPERLYSVVKDKTVSDLATMFATQGSRAGSSREKPIELN
ncbi:hypothetical protein K474DRAFT_1669400 [Panus rudis PR-1116 ss-1]|nr:hypothetical protein K474DRAFT_1669400 [Panus rudis PR-1116 ss-1]